MINFLSKEVFIEESAGRRKIFLIVEERIKEYEKRMLCDSDCPFTLPMHFIFEEGIMKVYYDFTGFIQLEEYIERKVSTDISDREDQKTICDALDVLSKILGCLKGMESYLIFSERISIHPDLVFINLSDGRIAFAFYPNEKMDMTFQNRIIEMVDAINRLYHDAETKQYLEKFKDYIFMKNPGLDGMIGSLGILQRDVSYIFWNTNNFRRAEEKETYQEYGEAGGNQKKSIDGRKQEEKQLAAELKRPASLKAIAIQAVIGAGLIAVFLSRTLEIVNFAGLIVITAGMDLWVMKNLRLKIRSSR